MYKFYSGIVGQSHFCLTNFYKFLVRYLRFIYTGNVEVATDNAQDLLRAADQYLLEGLKRLCEYSIAQVCFSVLNLPAAESCRHQLSFSKLVRFRHGFNWPSYSAR
jgi:hypothetical protein